LLFEFVQIADVHIPAGEVNFRAVIDDINSCVKPSFVVITGDITDCGRPEQYKKYLDYKALFDCAVYTGTGNHDLQWWTSNGKNDYKGSIGSLYYSFNYEGVHFVMLDSTVIFVTDGKCGKAQLEWLQYDLNTISREMPVIIFVHHPSVLHDNVTAKAELIRILKRYNIVAIMSGHMHRWGYTIENGIPWVYVTDQKNNNDQGYAIIKISSDMLYIYKRQVKDSSKVLWLTASMINSRKADMSITNVTVQENGNVDISVQIDKAPDGVDSVQASVDNYGPWTNLTQNGSSWFGRIDISTYSPIIPYGKHFVGVNMTDNVGKVWKEYKEYEWSGGNVMTKWVYQTDDIIQSTPTYYNSMIYTGSEDGKIYAINDFDGTLKWSYATEDQIISKPAIFQSAIGCLVIFGSNDKKVYALNADDGLLKWHYVTGGSVITDPLVDDGVVYFGSGDKYIYSLNANDGSFKWRYQTEGLMRQRPLVCGGILYAFVRDTHIWYAINTNDGSLYWRGNADTDMLSFILGDIRPVITGNAKLWCIEPRNKKAGYLNPTNGSLEWTHPFINTMGRIGPATDGTRIFYAANEGREIYAFNVFDNILEWYRDLRAGNNNVDLQEYQVDSALIYDEGILYHVSERGRLTGLNPVSGDKIFIYDAVGFPERSVWQTPEVHNKTIYFGGLDGKIYAVKYNGDV